VQLGADLQKAELAQFPPQRFRHGLRPWRYPIEVARTIFVGKVTPALERSPRTRLDQHEFRLEHQLAATNSPLVDKRPHVQESLPTRHFPPDHPIERTAIAEFVRTSGYHARAVDVLAGQSAPFALFESAAYPILQLFDRVAADTELDEMKRHVRQPAVPYCASGAICNGPDPAGPPLGVTAWRGCDAGAAGFRAGEAASADAVGSRG
jgi:hypothetical protein